MFPRRAPFMAGMGATFVGLFVMEHLIYGAIVGALYGPVEHAAGRPVTSAEGRRF